eukprot:4052326-Prymnesium_polylepis.1
MATWTHVLSHRVVATRCRSPPGERRPERRAPADRSRLARLVVSPDSGLRTPASRRATRRKARRLRSEEK